MKHFVIFVSLLLLKAFCVPEHLSYAKSIEDYLIEGLWQQHYKEPSDQQSSKYNPEYPVGVDDALKVETKFGAVYGQYAPPERSMDPRKFPIETKRSWVRAYLGLPFAKPPVGHLRFAHSVKWNQKFQEVYGRDYLNLTEYGPQCIQTLPFPPSFLAEDCLYMNIFKPPPHMVNSDEKLPVLFWSFGGAWMFGSGGVGAVNGLNMYSGNAVLLEHKYILVTANVRVSSLGYMNAGYSKGNYGLLDLVTALEYVYENIESFGGDKERITLAGMSSGSYNAVMTLLASRNAGNKIISKLWLMSAPLSFRPRSAAEGYRRSEIHSKRLGCDLNDLYCLRKVSVVKLALLEARPFMINNTAGLKDPLQWFITEDPEYGLSPELNTSMFEGLDIVVGTTRYEAALFFVLFETIKGGSLIWYKGDRSTYDTMKDWVISQLPGPLQANAADRMYKQAIKTLFADRSEDVLAKYPAQHRLMANVYQLMDVFSQRMFVCPSLDFAADLTKQNISVKYYEQFQGPSVKIFSEGHMGKFRAPHGLDLLYLFKYFPDLHPDDEKMSDIMLHYLTEFMGVESNSNKGLLKMQNSKQPIIEEFQTWPRFDKQRLIMKLGKYERDSVRMEKDKYEEICNFWRSF